MFHKNVLYVILRRITQHRALSIHYHVSRWIVRIFHIFHLGKESFLHLKDFFRQDFVCTCFPSESTKVAMKQFVVWTDLRCQTELWRCQVPVIFGDSLKWPFRFLEAWDGCLYKVSFIYLPIHHNNPTLNTVNTITLISKAEFYGKCFVAWTKNLQ